MVAAPITYDDLVVRFPEMTRVDPCLAVEVIDEAIERIGDHWPANMRARAQLYLAAHMLASEGGADRSIEGAVTGPIVSKKEGDLAVGYAAAGGGAAAYQAGNNYTDTPYGRRFAELQKAAFGGSVFAV